MKFVHISSGNPPSKRRIYIDPGSMSAYSVNTKYAGNSVGLKKLSLRLCIYKGFNEDWLCEHNVYNRNEGEGSRAYIYSWSFPRGERKTSTVMVADSIVGDDLAIIRNVGGEARGVNPETGMFGIIDGVNPQDDPELYGKFTSESTGAIFSNVLLTEDGEIWWEGKPEPARPGINYSGKWWPWKVDERGRSVPASHPNARFTIGLGSFEKIDESFDNPNGVEISALVFGGRDSDTWVPVEESFDWAHGIVTRAASLESERTSAVLGETGALEFNPFAIIDFLPISIADYIDLHLRFEDHLRERPRVFGVNYFLTNGRGEFLFKKGTKGP